jgi:hypothetical protein
LVDGDKEKAKAIWDTSRDVLAYCRFKGIINLGVHIGLNDLPFEKMMIFSLIEEASSDRQTRV